MYMIHQNENPNFSIYQDGVFRCECRRTRKGRACSGSSPPTATTLVSASTLNGPSPTPTKSACTYQKVPMKRATRNSVSESAFLPSCFHFFLWLEVFFWKLRWVCVVKSPIIRDSESWQSVYTSCVTFPVYKRTYLPIELAERVTL